MAAEVPKWLISILGANFHDPCKEHKDKEYTLFCLDCDGKVFCKSCQTQCSMHANHVVQQVYKASHRAVLRIEDISLFFEISDIHPYSINSYPIVFLRPRTKAPNHISTHANVAATHKCEICSYDFSKSSKSASCKKRNSFRFCSLACKAKSMMDLTNANRSYARIEVLNVFRLTANGNHVLRFSSKTRINGNIIPANENSKSFRKRSRKGIPKRAPLF